MIIVTLQFNRMKNADHGYRIKGVYYGSTVGMEGSKIATILNELRAMPEVEKVGLGYDLPMHGAPGNNIRSEEGGMDLFNIADFYQADENFLSILNIQVSAGYNFSPENATTNDLLISEKGAELLKLNFGWTDGVVGKQLEITEHGSTTVCGVFPDFIINSLSDPDSRPSVFFYLPEAKFEQMKIERPDASFKILVKIHEGAEAGMSYKLNKEKNLFIPIFENIPLLVTLRNGSKKSDIQITSPLQGR